MIEHIRRILNDVNDWGGNFTAHVLNLDPCVEAAVNAVAHIVESQRAKASALQSLDCYLSNQKIREQEQAA